MGSSSTADVRKQGKVNGKKRKSRRMLKGSQPHEWNLNIAAATVMDNTFRILASSKSSRKRALKYYGASIPDAGQQKEVSETPGWGDIDSFCNKYGFYQENPVEDLLSWRKHKELQEQPDEEQFVLSHPKFTFLSSSQQITQLKNAQAGSSRTEDREMINKITGKCANETEVLQKVSTEKILRLAGERFVQISSQKLIDINTFEHPHESSVLSAGLCSEDKQDVELAQLLLAAAEKVRFGKYDRASKLINNCQWIGSTTGTPVQRIVYYFSEALVERIKNETGLENEEKFHVDANCVHNDIHALLAMQEKLPFFQVMNLTVTQTLLENVKMKSKVHVIDFHILKGMHLAAFLQDLAAQELESIHLTITVVETVNERGAHTAGKLLESFAKHLNLPLCYKVVFLPSILDLKEEHFEIEGDETVALLFPCNLRNLISKPVCLQNLMTVIQKIRPSVMVVVEVEANHNSPSFVNRFIEAMFFYGALFDSLEEIMARDCKDRMAIESRICHSDIVDIVAAEGYDRVIRSVSINVWRAFFGRFGLIEMELSTASLYQACLVLNQFPRGEWCTLDIGSKCLLVGWKGTPIFSVSAWKFP